MADTNALKPCPLDLVTLLRRFAEVYATQKGLPWIGTVRPEQAFARAADALEARPEQQNTGEPAPEYYRDEPSLETSQSVIRRRAWREAQLAAPTRQTEGLVEALAEALQARTSKIVRSGIGKYEVAISFNSLANAHRFDEALALLNPEGKP